MTGGAVGCAGAGSPLSEKESEVRGCACGGTGAAPVGDANDRPIDGTWSCVGARRATPTGAAGGGAAEKAVRRLKAGAAPAPASIRRRTDIRGACYQWAIAAWVIDPQWHGFQKHTHA